MNDRAHPEVAKMAEPQQPKAPMTWPKAFLEMLGSVLVLFFGFTWLLGFVFAKGAWSTVFCVIPFYAWYLDVERVAQLLHWI
jgi:hypothetical protein